MREFLEQLINRIREFWGQLDLTRRLILLGGALAVVLLIIFAVIWFGRGNFVTLYAGLSPQDMARAEVVLKRNGIDYKINRDYKEILVPIDRYDEAQILIAEQETISGGASAFGSRTYQRTPGGYEILERGALSLMSDKEFKEFKRQALEGEIAYTLASFEGVRRAKVGLALPEPEIFVKDQEEPRASVLLTLESERFDTVKFEPNKVIPIMQKIVAYRVPGLLPENVQIADTEGRFDSAELARKDIPAEEMLRQLKIEKEYERRFNQTVRQALQKYGDKIASVQVRVKVDLSQKNITEEKFTPVVEDEGLARSLLEERESFEGEGVLPGGVPGVSSNVPPEYMGTEAVGPSTYDRSKRIENYEMNRTVIEEVTKPTYEIVSASALIDLSLQQEVDSIRNIIAKTLNISDDKIAIEATSFPVEAVEILKEAKPIWYRLVEMAIVALIVIAILLFLRSMIRRREEVVEEPPKVAGVEIPSGMTVREFIDQQLEERVSLFERERELEEEKEKELEEERKRAETAESNVNEVRRVVDDAKNAGAAEHAPELLQKAETLLDNMERALEAEDYGRVNELAPDALEAARSAQETAERTEVTVSERDRREQVLEEIKQIARENPESIAEALRLWLQPEGESIED